MLTTALNTTGEVTGIFLQYGVLGVFALFGLYFFRIVYKRETERADRAEVQLAELNRDIRERIIPVLTEANRLVAEATALALREGRK
jgi:hypothetical protein